MTDADKAGPRRTINPVLKLVLELGPLILFFAAYSRFGLLAATAVMMATVVVTLCVSYALLRRIPIMPLVTAIIVVIFGSLTLIFQNDTFIKMKPTVLYLLFGGALFGGLALNRADIARPVRRRAQCDGGRLAQTDLALGLFLSRFGAA